jgi:hypothetical protein
MGKRTGKSDTKPDANSSVTDDRLRLTGELFWKYRAVDSDYVRIQHQLKSTQEEIQMFVDKTPALKEIFSKRAELLNQSSVAQTELKAVLDEIEKTLGIDVKGCSIDEKTGVIHVLQEGVMVPVGKKPNKKGGKTGAGR